MNDNNNKDDISIIKAGGLLVRELLSAVALFNL
jgi:hypothetical protein